MADIIGTNGDDTLTGTGGSDSIFGLAGNDSLDGGAGVDTTDGGLGDDWHVVGDAADIVIERAGEGNDRVAALASYKLTAGAEVETLSTTNAGGNGAIALTGNEFGQTLIGNAGNNFLYGFGGADTLDGGAGGDLIIVDGDDLVIEAAGGGNDLVAALSSFALNAGAEVETLSTINGGSNAAIALTGNEFGQKIIGNAGDNFLYGRGGADTLDGGAGSDVIIVDTDDVVIDTVGGDNDLVAALTSYKLAAGARVETLSTTNAGGNAAIALNGNELSNHIIGNAGNNFLDGGLGTDILDGGAGDDTIIVGFNDGANDNVIEAVGGGNDLVAAWASYVLSAGAEVETLSTTSTGESMTIALTGNEFGQTILGNRGRNVLDGKLGNDTLIGGDGVDTFRFTTALAPDNVDMIDFAQATDKIQLDDAIFTNLNSGPETDPLHPIALNANVFALGTAAQEFDDRIIYDKTTGQLFYDADGLGGSAAILFATLQNGPVLSASDFQVI